MPSAPYSRLTRGLHWLTLLIFIVLLASGLASASPSQSGQPVPTPLLPHMIMGIALLFVLVWRIWRKARGKVPKGQSRLAEVGHWTLLIVTALMVASGIATSIAGAVMPAAVSGGGMPDLSTLPPRAAHGVLYWLLIGLVLGHAAMAAWHQWGLRDGALKRMMWGAG